MVQTELTDSCLVGRAQTYGRAVTDISEQGPAPVTPVVASRRDSDTASRSAHQRVADSLTKGWTVMSDIELAAVTAWHQTKAAQETGSWPIPTAVVGSAAVATAYMYEHGLASNEAWSG